MADFSPEDLAAMDPGYWAVLNKVRLVSGTFSFEDHPYQKDMMQSRSRRMCYMKGTQGGISEVEILKTLHGLIHHRYPQGVLYMFPTTDNMREFSKSRFNPLIRANPESIGKYVKSQRRKGTDTAGLKRIHDAYLYLRGARLTQSYQGGSDEKGSVQLLGIPVDRLVFDELDLMNEAVIEKARGRLGHSRLKEEVYIANPTLPDYGIDKVFRQSDQRHLHRKCEACGEWTCAEVEFPGCVKVREDGTGYVACRKCGRPVGLEDTEWVPAEPDHSDHMEGYRWSQLSSVFNDPAEILAAFNEPPEGNLADVYRNRLGLPYVAAENRLTRAAVLRCCGPDYMQDRHEGPCAMGVDVGKVKHVVIGLRPDRKRLEIVKVAAVSKWRDIHDLARRYGVKSAVIDALPYQDEARAFQDEEPYRISLCQYDEHTVLEARFNEEEGLVKVNRTEICDKTHRLVEENRLALPRRCPDVDAFAKQCCNTAKVLEENKRTGSKIFRYHELGSGGDHYRHALNYLLLAAGPTRLPTAPGSRPRRPQRAVNNLVLT